MSTPDTPTSHLMPTYAPAPVTFVRGAGTELWDDTGKRYLDLLSGLAVTSLGHSHPAVADALAAQARTLLHVSNLFRTQPGEEVAACVHAVGNGVGSAHILDGRVPHVVLLELFSDAGVGTMVTA